MDYFSTKEIENWMNFYYQNPQPDLIPIFIKSLSQEGFLTKENTQEPIMCFLSLVFRDNSEKIRDWLSQFWQDLSTIEQEVMIKALFLANTEETQAYLRDKSHFINPEIQELIESLETISPPDLAEISIDYPPILDNLWAAFMATGSEKYVINIIGALSKGDETNDPLSEMIMNMAQWSLSTHIKTHEKVKDICSDQLTKQPEYISSILRNLLMYN